MRTCSTVLRRLVLAGQTVGFILCAAAWAQTADPFPQQAAAYVLLVQGETLWARQSTRLLPPASLTKIMTALPVLERARLHDVVRISQAAARETGALLGLRPGESMRVSDLLAAALLGSANDACHALADHVGGSEARAAFHILTGAILLALAGATVARNHTYRSEVALWEDAARKSPMKARVYNNLGYAYVLGGRDDDARHAYLTALRLNPDFSLARANLGALTPGQP